MPEFGGRVIGFDFVRACANWLCAFEVFVRGSARSLCSSIRLPPRVVIVMPCGGVAVPRFMRTPLGGSTAAGVRVRGIEIGGDDEVLRRRGGSRSSVPASSGE